DDARRLGVGRLYLDAGNRHAGRSAGRGLELTPGVGPVIDHAGNLALRPAAVSRSHAGNVDDVVALDDTHLVVRSEEADLHFPLLMNAKRLAPGEPGAIRQEPRLTD